MNIVDAPKTGTFQMRINPEVIDRCGKRILSAVAQCWRTAVPDESKQRSSYPSAGNCAFAGRCQGW